MLALAALMGVFAAHAVWSVSDGETLIPIYAYVDSDGKRHMNRLVYEHLEDAVEAGRKRLEENPENAQYAVLIYDGYLPLEGTKTDAVLIEAIDAAKKLKVIMAVPYLPGGNGDAFRVYRPKFVAFPAGEDMQAFVEKFWEGVDSHEKGAQVWNAHLDQSK